MEEYDGLTPEDIQACFLFAAKSYVLTPKIQHRQGDDYGETLHP